MILTCPVLIKVTDVTTFAMKPIIVKTNWILCNKVTQSDSSSSDIKEWEKGRLLLSFVKLSLTTVKGFLYHAHLQTWTLALWGTLLETLSSVRRYLRRWVGSSWRRCLTASFFCHFFFTEAWSQKSNRDHTEKVTEIITYVWTLILCTWASNKKEFFPSRLRRSKNFLSQSSELIETSFLNFQLRSLNSIFM